MRTGVAIQTSNYDWDNVCFWSNTVNSELSGIGNTADPNVIGESTTNMQTEKMFTDAGWDFSTPVWTIDEGVDYPRLWWEFVPILHIEPEVTLGTSNTISWGPVYIAVEYYAECSEDANFASIINNSGWITETSFEFTGLELGKRYWYSVKARNTVGTESSWSNVETSLQGTLADAVAIMLDPNNLKSENLKKPYINKINVALEMIDEGLYEDALSKLEQDILEKTNGCGDAGKPDKNDWIITCEHQNVVYPLVVETVEYVKNLME
jgi:hypothetical protein